MPQPPYQLFSDAGIGIWRFYNDCRLLSCRTLDQGQDILAQLLRWHGSRRPLIVTDAQVSETAACQHLRDAIGGPDILVGSECALAELQCAQTAAKEYQPDLVIAIGGGSVLDAAKLLTAGLAFDLPIHSLPEFAGPAGRALPLVCIPTTFGTGSEANMISHLGLPGGKIGFRKPWLTPTAALLIGEIAQQNPFLLRFLGAVDAWLHAFEAFCLTSETSPIQQALLREALVLHIEHLSDYLTEPDPESAQAMTTATVLAGIGLNNGRTCLIHALAGPFAAAMELPHAQSLLPFLECTLGLFLDVLDKRGRHAALTPGRVNTHVREVLLPPARQLMSGWEYQMPPARLDSLVEACLADRVAIKETPFPVTPALCRDLYRQALQPWLEGQ